MKTSRILVCIHCGKSTPKLVLKRTGGYCEAHAFMTVTEAYIALRVSRSSYYRLCEAGKLKPRKVGLGGNGRVVVLRREVDALLFV